MRGCVRDGPSCVPIVVSVSMPPPHALMVLGGLLGLAVVMALAGMHLLRSEARRPQAPMQPSRSPKVAGRVVSVERVVVTPDDDGPPSATLMPQDPTS